MHYFKNKLFSNCYFCLFLLFTLACVVKWFYLNHQNYYIVLSDEMPGAYSVAEGYSIIEILRRLFIHGEWRLGSVRPFVTLFLYVLGFKIGGFHSHTVFFLGIILGSLLVPLYYLIIAKLLNQEIALFSSLALIFLTNYIEQSLALTTQLPGIVFLALSLLFVINYYKNRRLWRLYLSGFFLTLSGLCRYGNALFIPFFILYSFLFDRKTKTYLKIVYWIVCLSGSIYILVSNFKLMGNPLYFIYEQNIIAIESEGGVHIGFLKAGLVMWKVLCRLIWWPIWLLGICSICFITLKYKNKALLIISSFFVFLGFLFYKNKRGVLGYNENYFLIFSLAIIPVAFEFLRSIVLSILKKSTYPYISLMIVLGLLIRKFNNDNTLFIRFRYPKELVKITEDLRDIPPNSSLYIDDDLQGFSMLFYLKRHPQRNLYWGKKLGEQKIEDKSFYLLIPKDKMSQVSGNEKVLVKDYNDLGLYKVTNLQDNH